MEYTTYASRLRYLDADDVDDDVVDYDGLDVVGTDGQKLGDVDGFIVDADASRLYYVVVDSGGWFRSRQFLLPVGHATLEADRGALRVDVAKDAISRYPEFDSDRFRQFSDEDLRAFESRLGEACCPDETRDATGTWSYDRERHYRQPEWWAHRGHQSTTATGAAALTSAAGAYDRARHVPVEDADDVEYVEHDRHDGPDPLRGRDQLRDRTDADTHHDLHDHAHHDHDRDPELVTARENDESPHFDGRAQPGNVLGIETGGERTGIGDTAEDEDKRRVSAERTTERDRRSER